MLARAHIDQPSGTEINKPHFHLYGWYTSPESSAAQEPVHVFLNGRELSVSVYRRPDVEAAFPKVFSRGFSAFLWLSNHVEGDRLRLTVDIGSRSVAEKSYTVSRAAAEAVASQLRAKESKRQWLLRRLRCPVCHSAIVDVPKEEISCAQCGTAYPIDKYSLNLIPPPFRTAGEIQFQGNICSHGYDRDVMEIVEGIRSRQGMVLDCGAGYRGYVDPNIVTTEITAYPTTDVLAANQTLPFQDKVFDAVLSLHVLEHVSDPFLCAQELVRVTRPGGVIFAVTPMIVPEHGYPYHFFNPTIEGLKRLFPSSQVERIFVPRMGHAMNGVRSILDLYAHNLPDQTKKKFLRMTVSELLAGTLEECIDKDFAVQLSEEGRRRLAANFALRVRKESDSATGGCDSLLAITR